MTKKKKMWQSYEVSFEEDKITQQTLLHPLPFLTIKNTLV